MRISIPFLIITLSLVLLSSLISTESVSGKLAIESFLVSFLSIYPIRIVGDISMEFVNLISSTSRSHCNSYVPMFVWIFHISPGTTEMISGTIRISFSSEKSVAMSNILSHSSWNMSTERVPSIEALVILSGIVRIERNRSTESNQISDDTVHLLSTQVLFFISIPIISNFHQP